MNEYPLRFQDGHLFVEMAGELWFLDTGAPMSFGTMGVLEIAGMDFSLEANYLGLTAEALSGVVGTGCTGLLGADVLAHFDHILDAGQGTLTLSTEEDLAVEGARLPLTEFMGIPILTAQVRGRDHQMFFDTGAQISYLQDDSLTSYPSLGEVTDFYPGFGEFQTETFEVPIILHRVEFALRCGQLPSILGMTLIMAGTSGIVGNQVLADRIVGYFPGRSELILQEC